ncbi:MAG: RNA polymerase sigma factor [Bacteroidales bacterium]|nr:RNA polymerase sigma factor [Bacteroidales bacterium]
MKNNILHSLSDEEILLRMQSDHNPDYYEILYNRYYHKVLDKCYSLVKDRQQAIELAKDIFSKTYEKLGTFKYLSSFSSWLYSITYNHCIDYLRSRKKLHYPEWNRQNEMPEIIDETEENLEVISYENLLIILEMIHPEEKALLYMKYQDNLSLRQISESLRISEDAAKMRLKRARARVIYLYKQKYSDKYNT